jgi:hypothetical protein
MIRTSAALIIATALAISIGACSSDGRGQDPTVQSVASQDVRVNETLRVSIIANNPDGRAIDWTWTGPDLPALRSVVRIAGDPGGAELEWTPLASHVGAHELVVTASWDGGSIATSVFVTVAPGADAAPVFLSPGAGGTFDLSRDPCVGVDIEVRDDDSPDVEIRAGSPLPDGAELFATGPRSGRFEWCPTPDQLDAATRWTIVLVADDREHAPTTLSYVIVLRAPTREGCPGLPPVVEIVAPVKGDTVASSTGYAITARVTDDIGLRDLPLLYYTTDPPQNEDTPDLTAFDQATCARGDDADRYTCRIPSLGLSAADEQIVWVVVSATDNDDAEGATCDKTTDSDTLRFVATGSNTTTQLDICAPCDSSDVCGSGLCGFTRDGARCLPRCDDRCEATCIDATTSEGGIASSCGVPDAVCGLDTSDCVDDDREPNDDPDGASDVDEDVLFGTICPGNEDWFAVPVVAGDEVTVTIDGFDHADGDLDLRVVDGGGGIIAVSEGVTGTESVTFCAASDDTRFAVVYGFLDDTNDYLLQVTSDAVDCCVDDEFEEDDRAAEARPVDDDGYFDGTICPDDDDWIAIDVEGSATLEVLLLSEDTVADLDLELYRPDGTLARAAETAGDEELSFDVTPGRWTLRVYGFFGDSSPYVGEVTLTPR